MEHLSNFDNFDVVAQLFNGEPAARMVVLLIGFDVIKETNAFPHKLIDWIVTNEWTENFEHFTQKINFRPNSKMSVNERRRIQPLREIQAEIRKKHVPGVDQASWNKKKSFPFGNDIRLCKAMSYSVPTWLDFHSNHQL